MSDSYFSIPVLIPETDVLTFLSINDKGEIYETELFGQPISLFRNEDDSWSLVKGDIDQETLKVIGDAIKEHHLKHKNR